jgi:hypothetical protein
MAARILIGRGAMLALIERFGGRWDEARLTTATSIVG